MAALFFLPLLVPTVQQCYSVGTVPIQEQYQNYVQQVITEYAQLDSSKDEIEQQLIFDTVRNHYHSFVYG
ncbi:element excision factor XisI family protein [Brasilonema sp. UFV-L1]|uniref:element excision factor XisI family protein n=1 Tax=Brasilonema sp. UFV-L1 TaxID=2234130 RepID=UPI00145D92B3|nr:element excision factor XisI family protein [Brasilonema sp. UFV-L1]NMG08093.1 hypothetical protein [Brasilonema sp. UFV-L1]